MTEKDILGPGQWAPTDRKCRVKDCTGMTTIRPVHRDVEICIAEGHVISGIELVHNPDNPQPELTLGPLEVVMRLRRRLS